VILTQVMYMIAKAGFARRSVDASERREAPALRSGKNRSAKRKIFSGV
jgi:hypothetical protein